MQAYGRVPEHVAIIMDGNGRWASARGLPRAAGHRAGAKSLRKVVEKSGNIGIKRLTLFAFSSENWQRPRTEVKVLLDLFLRTLRRELEELHANHVRLQFIGARHRFSPALQQEMSAAEQETRHNCGLQLVVAVDYGGRWDIARAAQDLANACIQGEVAVDTIDEALFARYLHAPAQNAPDLFIRTGGEQRLSNFLLWDLAYSELYFTDVFWPDFNAEELAGAVQWYATRERRFGRIATAGDNS